MVFGSVIVFGGHTPLARLEGSALSDNPIC
jgi:hypothetical protein